MSAGPSPSEADDVRLLHRRLFHDPARVAADPDWAMLSERLPPKRVALARESLEGTIETWRKVFGLRRRDLVREADTEDWVENAVTLLAPLQAGHPVEAIGPDDALAQFVEAGRSNALLGAPAGISALHELASEARNALVWPPRGERERGEDYWRSPALLRALGRLARIADGRPEEWTRACRELVEAGAQGLVVKMIFRAKYQPVAPLPLPRLPSGETDASGGAVFSAMMEACDANLYACADVDEALLIQEERPMRCEYRVVVLDGRPVAGAGCIEALSPIFHDPADGPFDALVEWRRGEGEIEARPELVTRFVAEAERLGRELEAEPGGERFRSCVMDFALDLETGGVLLVETNPASAFGLYAMDWGAVSEAMISLVQSAAATRPAAVVDAPAPTG